MGELIKQAKTESSSKKSVKEGISADPFYKPFKREKVKQRKKERNLKFDLFSNKEKGRQSFSFGQTLGFFHSPFWQRLPSIG